MKRILMIFVIALSVVAASACGATQTRDPNSVEVIFTAEEARGSISGKSRQLLMPNEVTEGVTAEPNVGFKFSHWSDGVTEAYRSGESFGEDTEIVACFEIAYTELPMFRFTMESGDEVTSKTEYSEVTLTISNTDEEYCLDGVSALLRGRGNATWNMEKKAYKLKLDEKENLLGQGKGKAKQWVLLANHCDQSMLRNYLAFYLGTKLDGLEHTSSASFVEVMINNDYKGVYLLCEQTQTNKYRVNIETEEDKLDTGYLIELDKYADSDEDSQEGVTYFTVNGRNYGFKDDVTSEQCAYMKEYITQTEAAIMSGDRARIERYIDLDSCVDMYLVQEYMMNIDVGWSSFYMYKKPGDKLYFGPIWDFDLAAGNDGRLWGGGYKWLYVGAAGHIAQANQWYIALMKQEWFRTLVIERWNETKQIFNGASAEAERMAGVIKNAADRNYERWDSLGEMINQEPAHIVALKSFDEHAQYLCEWLSNRFKWLDDCFANIDDYKLFFRK